MSGAHHVTSLIAHRGCAGQYPENTVFAVEQVAPHVDAIEIDVRRCGSGELVVFHDRELDRLTDATGVVAETPWAELRELDVLGSGEPIPRFASLVAAVPDRVGLDVELKEPGLADDVMRQLDDWAGELTLTANDPAVLEELASAAPSVPRGFIFWADPHESLAVASDHGCEVVAIEHELCLAQDLVEPAHDAGLDVWAWTVVDRSAARALVAAGVDGLIADRMDVL